MNQYFIGYRIVLIAVSIIYALLRSQQHYTIIVIKKRSPNHYKWGALNIAVALLGAYSVNNQVLWDQQALILFLTELGWIITVFDLALNISRPDKPWNYLSDRHPRKGGNWTDYLFHEIPNVQFVLKIIAIVFFTYKSFTP